MKKEQKFKITNVVVESKKVKRVYFFHTGMGVKLFTKVPYETPVEVGKDIIFRPNEEK